MATTNLHGNPPMVPGGEIGVSRFVRLSTTAGQTLLQAGNNERAFGISGEGERITPGLITALGGTESSTPHAVAGTFVGGNVLYYGTGQYCLLECGTGWTPGALLTSDANGRGKPAATTNPVNAVALTAASATGNQRRLVRVADGWTSP